MWVWRSRLDVEQKLAAASNGNGTQNRKFGGKGRCDPHTPGRRPTSEPMRDPRIILNQLHQLFSNGMMRGQKNKKIAPIQVSEYYNVEE